MKLISQLIQVMAILFLLTVILYVPIKMGIVFSEFVLGW